MKSLRRTARRTVRKIKAHWLGQTRSKMPQPREPSPGDLEFYSQFIPRDGLVFDVGANVGDKAAAFLRLGARVVCVEPQPQCVAFMEKRFEGQLGNDSLILVGKGLASEPGELELAICDDAPTISTFSRKWQTGRFQEQVWARSEVVPVTTLDCLIDEYGLPCFCKIDVEGFELEVLKGLSKPLPRLSFEFTREFLNDAGDCMRQLTTLGDVTFNWARGGGMGLPEWCGCEELLQALADDPDSDLHGDIHARFPTSDG